MVVNEVFGVGPGCRRRAEEPGRDRDVEGPSEGTPGDRILLTGRVGADIRAAPRRLAGGIHGDLPALVADDPHQLALLAGGPARDAGPGREPPHGHPAGRDAGYDDTPFVASLAWASDATAAGTGVGSGAGSCAWASLRMLMRQPVSFAARLAF